MNPFLKKYIKIILQKNYAKIISKKIWLLELLQTSHRPMYKLWEPRTSSYSNYDGIWGKS